MENNSDCLYIINILPFMIKSFFELFVTKVPKHILVKTIDVIYKVNHMPSNQLLIRLC